MKVEASKNNPVDKKESKNVFKSENSVFETTSKPVPPTAGAFAKILEENRRENEKANRQTAKNEPAESDAKAAKSERDEKISRTADEKKEAEERGGKNDDNDASQNGDESRSEALTYALLQSNANVNSEWSAPPARSILHVADLERIVSTIRTESFQNQKQVTIALKNSVLQGLQIKLTLDADGKVKAEFLAAGEPVKKQLRQRRRELSEILKNRSSLFSEIEIESQNPGEQE